MSDERESDRAVYIIPPNFIETGSILGGMIKIRNAIESLIITVLILFPILKSNFSLTVKIVIICLTALPAGLISLIGIGEDSLIEYITNFFKFLRKRRVIKKIVIPKEKLKTKKIYMKNGELNNEIDPDKFEVIYYEDDDKVPEGAITAKDTAEVNEIAKDMEKAKFRIKDQESLITYIPIKKIENGIIWTNDGRYIKIIEIEPINFLLRSSKEQKSIIYSFASFLNSFKNFESISIASFIHSFTSLL